VSLHVGLDLVYLQEDSGGSATYARELIPALHAAHPGLTITAWVSRDAPADLERSDWGVRWVRLPLPAAG
jgi:hypothetical protein